MSMLLQGLHKVTVNFKVRILLILFAQVMNKHLRMNASINFEFLAEMLQNFGRATCQHKKKNRYLDKLTV